MVHPTADLFPLMSSDELDEMAEDIAEHGLIEPIVLDADGTLIDGRNRLEACKRAGVEPSFTPLNGRDAVAFILSRNVQRRMLTAGQRAMTWAVAEWLKTDQSLFSRGKVRLRGTQAAADALDIDVSLPQKAAAILRYSPDLRTSVMGGTLTIEAAYRDAVSRKKAEQNKADLERGRTVRLTQLRDTSSELADMVLDGRLSLEEAEAAQRERVKQQRQEREQTTRVVVDVVQMVSGAFSTASSRETVRALFSRGEAQQRGVIITKQRLTDAATALALFASEWEDS